MSFYVYIVSINFYVDEAVDFIKSIATYKNKRSAAMLEAILNKKTVSDNSTDSYIKEMLLDEIVNNKGEAYSKIEKEFAKEIHQYQENMITVPLSEPVDMPVDTSKRNISWWR